MTKQVFIAGRAVVSPELEADKMLDVVRTLDNQEAEQIKRQAMLEERERLLSLSREEREAVLKQHETARPAKPATPIQELVERNAERLHIRKNAPREVITFIECCEKLNRAAHALAEIKRSLNDVDVNIAFDRWDTAETFTAKLFKNL